MAAMKAAKESGVLLLYDPNMRLLLWSSAEAAREGINSIWTYADVIKVNDDEVEFLTQGDATDEKNVLSLQHAGLKLLMVTDGEKGCRYFTKVNGKRIWKSFKFSFFEVVCLYLYLVSLCLKQNFKGAVKGFAVNTVDTTGAGGCFYSSVLEDENKLRDALTHANACGAICTTVKEAIPALPDNAA
ncbi:hypothetical protein MKX01_000424 [Papaver californicum]|nr:hypothetical protein MKX01_000424 [Papaver californicum]